MEIETDASRLIARLDMLRHPSDLDLLVFFARHPRSLLASERLAAFLGYCPKEIAASLDLLLAAKVISRTPHAAHAARLYVFDPTPAGDWLPSLLKLASTRGGRLALLWALRGRSVKGTNAGVENKVPGDPLKFPVRRGKGTAQ